MGREEKVERETRERERMLLTHPPPFSTPVKKTSFHLSLSVTSLKTPITAVPKVAVVERWCVRKCEKIIFDSSSTRSLLRFFNFCSLRFVMNSHASFLTSVKLEPILNCSQLLSCRPDL